MTKRSYMKAVLDGLSAVDTVELVSTPFGKQCDNAAKSSMPFCNRVCGGQRKKICVRLLLSIDRRETTAAAMETVSLMESFLEEHVIFGRTVSKIPFLPFTGEFGIGAERFRSGRNRPFG